MTPVSICLLVAVACPMLCDAAITRLAPADRSVLEESSRFQAVPGVTNLPPAVVALCADDKTRLAEASGKWEATDVITNPTLPRRRLLWATTNGELWVVHYESGGRGHSSHVLVARKKQGDSRAKVLWRGVGRPLKDYAAFLAALASNSLDDEPEHAH